MSARITKNELIAINARLSAEVAALRAELSACKRLAASEYNKRVVSLLGELIARARAH